MRIGQGYDVHRLEKGRRLVLGGAEVPWDRGLLGHSDADVLLHAIMDALLGAAGLGDIGSHFPDTDQSLRGADSMELLRRTGAMLTGQQLRVVNIDTTITAQAPRLSPYREEMRQNIAYALQIDPAAVNVKFTTEEGLGFTGRGEGISAMAVCLLQDTL